MGSKEKQTLQTQIDNLNEQITANNEQENVINESTNVDNNEGTEKVVEKVIEKGLIPKFDPNKMKNKIENISYDGNIMYISQVVEGLNVQIDGSGVVKVTVYREGNSKEVKINGISGKVIDVCQGTLGDGSNEAIVFLTENGDVYFADNVSTATNAYQGNWTLNAQKVSSVSNICRMLWTMSTRNSGGPSSRATIIGIDTNGDCYDLWYECKGTK